VSDATIGDCRLMLGDCRERLRELPDGSVDAVICDPPYPCIDRPYGRLTEPEWHDLMHRVVAECRRVLTPTGSAVFVLQPNSERVGRMRPWLWDFLAWTCREWNQVQDAYWFNSCAMPTVHCSHKNGLMRQSIKLCVWLGDPDCYRDQHVVLIEPAGRTAGDGRSSESRLVYSPSTHKIRRSRILRTCIERGGATPFNLLEVAGRGGHGHAAATPHDLGDWWVRYLCPEGGTVLDPFLGSGTTALAALDLGRKAVGIERDPGYFDVAVRRLTEQHDRLRERLFA
jgi:hypothetical protein